MMDSNSIDPNVSIGDEVRIIPHEVDHVSEIEPSLVSNEEPPQNVRRKDYIAIGILFTINLLNYMDRFTIAGILDDVKYFYKLDDASVGLLQTSFIVSYMSLSPVFGYLGDRYNRKYMIVGGILIWSLITLASSFIPQDYFYAFLVMRSLVGIGEASYSTVAPTIIADLFTGDQRTKILSIFYFAIPVGSGFGYIMGTNIAKWMGNWQWALRFTPMLGIVCLILLIILVRDPTRGRSEGGTHLHTTSWLVDLRQLVRNRSFMFISLGFTAVSFVTGSLSWWVVIFINISIDNRFNDSEAHKEYSVAILFGVITCIAGLIGVLVGSETARRLRSTTVKADAYVCAVGLICSAPFLFGALVSSRSYFYLTFVLIFIGETFLCLNWSLVSDMTLSVVLPTRRSTASAFQMVISHALGDAGSPYIVGMISDGLADHRLPGMATTFISRQWALFINPFICILGGGFFLFVSIFIGRDKAKVHHIVHESREHYHTIGSSYEPIDESISVRDSRTPSIT